MNGPVPTGIWFMVVSVAARSSHSDGSTIPSCPAKMPGNRLLGRDTRNSSVRSSILRTNSAGSTALRNASAMTGSASWAPTVAITSSASR